MRRPASVNKNLSLARSFLGDRARGLALLRGEPPFLRRGGNPPAPAFPFGETGKGSKDSFLAAAGYELGL